jgi:hypothetical protein
LIVTTPPTPLMDVNPLKNVFEKMNSFSLPSTAGKNLKDIIYGLSYGNGVQVHNRSQKRSIDSNIKSNRDIPSSTEEFKSPNIEVTTSFKTTS